MLKSTCSMLENQVEELEIINEDYEEKQLQWNIARYYCNCDFYSGLIQLESSLVYDVHLLCEGRPNVILLGRSSRNLKLF